MDSVSNLAKAAPVAAWKAEAPLPLDPAVIRGRLDNGLAYYVRANGRPAGRAELRLVVNAGSLMEEDDQRGLAHFLEHMAFNGTESFAAQEIVDYLESIGMRFGPDLNAYTNYDETVYLLQVPTDDEKALGTGLSILEEWAHRMRLEDAEIEQERGVIIEEWRLGRGAEARIRDEQFQVLFKGSRYAARRPIGEPEIIRTFTPDTLRRFYRDWYRPDLMAVVAVGDFDPRVMEARIRETFSALTMPENPRPRIAYPIPSHEETLVGMATDAEATSSRLSVITKHPVSPFRTVADYRRSLVEGLYNNMLNQRLHELTRQPEPPFLEGYSAKGRIVRAKDFYILGARVSRQRPRPGPGGAAGGVRARAPLRLHPRRDGAGEGGDAEAHRAGLQRAGQDGVAVLRRRVHPPLPGQRGRPGAGGRARPVQPLRPRDRARRGEPAGRDLAEGRGPGGAGLLPAQGRDRGAGQRASCSAPSRGRTPARSSPTRTWSPTCRWCPPRPGRGPWSARSATSRPSASPSGGCPTGPG